MAKKLIRILAIDGGGVRGIIPALVLAELEKRSGKPVCALFDLLAGASTGAVLVSGLSVPGNGKLPKYRAIDAVNFYKKEAACVFNRPLLHQITTLNNITGPKYPESGIDTVLLKYYGETRLSQTLNELLIPAYDLQFREVFFFTRKKSIAPNNMDFNLKDVVRAATAAPALFPPKLLYNPTDNTKMPMVDGGIFANNPAMCALVEAMKIWPDENYLVLSLGTGQLDRIISYEKAKKWGLLCWAPNILDILFDGESDTVDHQLKKLLIQENSFRNYYRFQIPIPQNAQGSDNISVENLELLETLGNNVVDKYTKEIDELVKLL